MADTPQTGDPVTPGDSQTPVTTTSTPPVDNAGAAEVDRLRVEKEKADLRIRQLENEKADRIKAEEEDQRKQLAEQQEWKTLAEKNAADLKELRDTQDREARTTALITATDILLKDYPANVVEVAKTAGLSLTDDSEASKAALKEKLDTIKQQVGTVSPVSANNPSQPAAAPVNREELVTRDANGVSPMAMAGAKGDQTVVRQYIGSLPQIDEMRKMAGLPPKQV